jgi:hypothetical protein
VLDGGERDQANIVGTAGEQDRCHNNLNRLRRKVFDGVNAVDSKVLDDYHCCAYQLHVQNPMVPESFEAFGHPEERRDLLADSTSPFNSQEVLCAF